MSHDLRRTAGVISLLSILAGIGLGCSVTSEKIQTWKRTQRGPAKLRAAVRDTDLKLDLRVEAGLALADIGLVDPLAEDFGALSGTDREAVGQKLVAELAARIQGGSAGATTHDQLRAKDALFGLRRGLGEEQRRRVDGVLVPWVVADWPSRTRGEHSAEKIVGAVPPEVAGPALAGVVAQKPALVAVLAEQVRRVGRAVDRKAAAAKLVALAKGQDPISPQTLEALGRVGAPTSRSHLLQLGRSTSTDILQRVKALQALSLDPDSASVGVLRGLAADVKQPDPVRGAAFQALEAVAGTATADALAGIISTDRNETVRYRAVEGLVRCCGVAGLSKLLESLPRGYTYTRSDVSDFLEVDIKGLGAEALPVLRKALASDSWIARLVAIRVLGDIGTQGDVEALARLASDQTRLKGWEAGATLGSEAKAAAARVKQRK